MRKFSFVFIAFAVVASSACIVLAKDAMTAGSTYKFSPHGSSRQKGTVNLTAVGADKTRVTITITGAPDSAIEPAHVHRGNCEHPGGVIYPLTDVVAGHSMTIVKAPISKVAVPGNSVNVHKSAAQLNVYRGCADLQMAK